MLILSPTGRVSSPKRSISLLDISSSTPPTPGNEILAARFFAAICEREGIEHRVFEPTPGRGTLWARIRGDGSKRPLGSSTTRT
jgi:acetylornithine deacetylase/succinyl-diaminopimelate desuccinylase-like protein